MDGKLGYGLGGYPLVHLFDTFNRRSCLYSVAPSMVDLTGNKDVAVAFVTSGATLSHCREFIAPPALVTRIPAVECTAPEYLIISPPAPSRVHMWVIGIYRVGH